MSISVVSICNRALDLLGADTIVSLEDGSKAANLCQRNYVAARDAVLRAYPWNAAMRRCGLAAVAETPSWGFQYQYELPSGPNPARCLRLYATEAGEDYKVEGRRVLTDYAPPLNILYIGAVEDPSDYDPLLAEAIAARLAVILAANLTESPGRIDAMRIHYAEIMASARMADAQEGRPDALIADDWLKSRY